MPRCLAVLNEVLPDADSRVGVAEQIPLPDASVDAVVVGQAWHWVDVPVASREVARVLRPGGTLGLVWNIRDESVPWVAALTHAMHGSAAEKLIHGGGPRVGLPFTTLENREFPWNSARSREDLVAMVKSRSYYIAADAEGRAAIEERVDQVLGGLSELSNDGGDRLALRHPRLPNSRSLDPSMRGIGDAKPSPVAAELRSGG